MVMKICKPDTPIFIKTMLDWWPITLLARIGLTLPFWWSGVDKLLHPMSALSEIQVTGFPRSWTLYALLLIVQLGGSLSILVNRYAWLGAGALAVFTAIVTFMAHGFWRLEGAQRFVEMNDFMEHIALIAGLVFAALHCHEVRNSSR
jgi:transmembrane protein